ncbi:CinA family protein [Thalassobius sp. Cn5-15]|nr:CinA family protein [Thalassobius sp. Cn5-15]
MTLATEVLSALKARGWRVASAESCTGGMVMARLTDIAGSSAVVDRGFVTYSNAAKQQMLGVSGETLKTFGAVSEEVAREMAVGALRHSDAQVAVAITGIAGPGGSEHKPEGRVCFAIASESTAPVSETVEFGALGRAKVRDAAAEKALTLLKNAATTA